MLSPEPAAKWLSVVGIGEEGLAGLSGVGAALLAQATVVVGGKRHLAMLPGDDPREQLAWQAPFADSVQQIWQKRGQAVCVLASGDPMCYGVGVTLCRQIPLAEITIIPAPSAFSLACARLGWSLTEIETLSLCGRDLALLNSFLYPGAQILALSANRHTPQLVAQWLCQRGFGPSQLTVLERMGGKQERLTQSLAKDWGADGVTLPEWADLNTLAIEVQAEPGTALSPASRTVGLPDSAYHHDGQLTKREVRAVTLAALAPLPGQLLWDVGAGCGSIGIEWLRCDRRCRAIAIEQHSGRLQMIATNAASLGVPQLEIKAGSAPEALANLPRPDAIFIGGGVTVKGLLDTCWKALRPGGRLVVNTVTVESELVTLAGHQAWGGELTRIAIQRAEPVGTFLGWKAMAPVTQWSVVKPLT